MVYEEEYEEYDEEHPIPIECSKMARLAALAELTRLSQEAGLYDWLPEREQVFRSEEYRVNSRELV